MSENIFTLKESLKLYWDQNCTKTRGDWALLTLASKITSTGIQQPRRPQQSPHNTLETIQNTFTTAQKLIDNHLLQSIFASWWQVLHSLSSLKIEFPSKILNVYGGMVTVGLRDDYIELSRRLSIISFAKLFFFLLCP